jgi:hypothetical protein
VTYSEVGNSTHEFDVEVGRIVLFELNYLRIGFRAEWVLL